MDDWIRVEAEAAHQAIGDAYYVNLANVAAVHLFTEIAEHDRHAHPVVSVITTGGAVVKIYGEGARDVLRRALDRRELGAEGEGGTGERASLHLG